MVENIELKKTNAFERKLYQEVFTQILEKANDAERINKDVIFEDACEILKTHIEESDFQYDFTPEAQQKSIGRVADQATVDVIKDLNQEKCKIDEYGFG